MGGGGVGGTSAPVDTISLLDLGAPYRNVLQSGPASATQVHTDLGPGPEPAKWGGVWGARCPETAAALNLATRHFKGAAVSSLSQPNVPSLAARDERARSGEGRPAPGVFQMGPAKGPTFMPLGSHPAGVKPATHPRDPHGCHVRAAPFDCGPIL